MDAGFEERARREALRYGSDPWIFVRELIQNSRDAGASRVSVTAEERTESPAWPSPTTAAA
jgi:hypothetical protein